VSIWKAEGRIRTKSIRGASTERLLARLGYLKENWSEIVREFDQKNDLRARAREVVNIERELARRQIIFEPLTNGEHLKIDLIENLLVWPPEPRKRDRPYGPL